MITHKRSGEEAAKQLEQLVTDRKDLSYYDRRISYEEFTSLLDVIHEGSLGSSYWAPLVSIMRQISGGYLAEVYEHLASHVTEYAYSVGYSRRPFRTLKPKVHVERMVDRLFALYDLSKSEFSLMQYLTVPTEVSNNRQSIPYILAYELDRGNQDVRNALKDIFLGDNNTALLDRYMIRGMLLSHEPEAYRLLGQMLVAARLQEGLRQSIVESMDEGTLEGFSYLLQIILDQGFIRYSSVVRALDVWTGLNLEAANTRVVKLAIEYASICLQDQELCREWAGSQDALKMYMALWAAAVREENELGELIGQIMEQGELYQQVTAQYFLSQSQNHELRYTLSVPYLPQSDPELQSLLLSNFVYSYHCSYVWRHHSVDPSFQGKHKVTLERTPYLEEKEERVRLFDTLREMLLQMPKLSMEGPSRVFEWFTYSLTTDSIANKMFYLTAYDFDSEQIRQLIELKEKLSPDLRGTLINYYADDFSNEVQRRFILDSLSDKSVANREHALDRIRELQLAPQEVESIHNLLKLKTGALRQGAIKLLLEQKPEQLGNSIRSLLQSRSELQRLGALELLCMLKEDNKLAEQYDGVKHLQALIVSPTDKERPLMERLQQAEQKGLHNGFGLFDPNRVEEFLSLPDYPDLQVKELLVLPLEKIQAFLQGLSDLIHTHRDYEYTSEWYSGHKESYLLGARLERLKGGYYKQESEATSLEGFPLAGEWSRYWQNNELTTAELCQLEFYLGSDSLYDYYTGKLHSWNRDYYEEAFGSRGKDLLSKLYPMELIGQLLDWVVQLPYWQQVRTLLSAYLEDSDRQTRFQLSGMVLTKIIYTLRSWQEEKNPRIWTYLSTPWQSWMAATMDDDTSFITYFSIVQNLDMHTNFEEYNPDISQFVRALELRLIDDDTVYRELLIRRRSSQHVGTITGKKAEFVQKYPVMTPFRDQVLAVILELELNRGDLPTEVTDLARSIRYYEGMEYFIAILLALDQESFVRGYIYYGGTKKEVLSHLLQVCHPKEGDNAERLRELLKGKKLSEKRLLEAAMYAPQWIEIISDYLGWRGLRSAAWYFHAHVNESFTAEKETVVAHYSPISPAEFVDGAFDIRWFLDAYEELGEQRFGVLYQCAKYISGGANHRRSQLFADAVLGKLDLGEMKASVGSKRNKDHLLSYSLIPIGEDSKRDVLERYEFIQQFLKESRQFGSQRSASEAKAAAIALENLARNAGYPDVIRLKWAMEARKIEEVKHLFEPIAVEDLELKVVIDEAGRAELEVSKQGKLMKSMPSKYNKHPQVLAVKEAVAGLREQAKRAKAEFEKGMEKESAFTGEELANLMKNPAIAPLLQALVWKAGDRFGFYEAGQLMNASGEARSLSMEEQLIIAHPLHLYQSGEWSRYQRVLYERQLKQPFKQVFRELYLPNADELDSGAVSRRYAGHQIQPKRAVALLKSRQWTVNYEDGLQKVYHKENIIAQVYAMADWFSPSELEAPTLETVTFIDRRTYKPMEISQVPGIIFSEIMRDVDLVVSTAHAGGVDPEASLTTMELRKVIVAESLRLMKLTNVRLEGNFARIEGSLGEYGVHLGSGTVQKQATGMLYIIPVHSQHRGRLFLPFMDEDPKTSEILSKIVMLAQDNKIKDPHILEQLREGSRGG